MYEQNLVSQNNWKIFDRFVIILGVFLKLIIFECTVVCLSFIISPIILYALDNSKLELNVPFPFFLPGTSPDSFYDFELNVIYQSLGTLIISIFYAFFEMIFVIQILHVILLTNLLKSKIKTLNNINGESEACRVKVNKDLVKIILLHNELLS